jgi:hypothetical protein
MAMQLLYASIKIRIRQTTILQHKALADSCYTFYRSKGLNVTVGILSVIEDTNDIPGKSK